MLRYDEKLRGPSRRSKGHKSQVASGNGEFVLQYLRSML
jgi:hypothetical protein